MDEIRRYVINNKAMCMYMYGIGNGIQNMKNNDKWVYIASTHQLNSPKSNRNDPFKQHPL